MVALGGNIFGAESGTSEPDSPREVLLDSASSCASMEIQERPDSLVRIYGCLLGNFDHEFMGQPSRYACKTLIMLDGLPRKSERVQ
jgi:hypothetical protein